MEDAEACRHGVTHEGAFPDVGPRDWDRDRSRVGLVRTMLTALLAKLVGYDGPLADHSRTCFDITSRDEAAWWPAAALDREVRHEGTGLDDLRARALAALARLKDE